MMGVYNGIRAGCDNYMTVPYSQKEMILWLSAIFRRTDMRHTSLYGCHEWWLGKECIDYDEENHLFYLNGNLLSLTISETKILTEHTDNAEILLSRTRLHDKCFTTHAGYKRIIDTHVKNIRRKIGQKWIETVRGYGYKFVGSLKGCEKE